MSENTIDVKDEQRSIVKASVLDGVSSEGGSVELGGLGFANSAATIGTGAATSSNQLPVDPFVGLYENEALMPPYDARVLTTIIEQSSILPQCVEAMETNIEGFGYTLEPIPGMVKDEKTGKYPPDAEAEHVKLRNFFDYCNATESFTKLRRKTRRDYEVTGYGFWEIMRNGVGEPAAIEHVPAYTVRLLKMDLSVQDIKMKHTDESGQEVEINYPRRFRRFLQIKESRRVYFKEYGDPRAMDAISGEWLTPEDVANVIKTGRRLSGAAARIATEILYFYQYSSRTPYGIPRWIGSLPSALGERAADEVNLNYFDNKAVPPLAILVSGRLAPGTKEVIQEHVEKNIKGRNNFHSILILEVETPPNPMGGQQKAAIELKPLTDAIAKDGLFMEYQAKARDKVRSSFRMPKIFVGETDDYNRATADASRDVANEQIFGPERDDFDFTINRVIFPQLGVKSWKFKTLAATQDNAMNLTEITTKLGDAGLTVREARQVMAEILNKDLPEPEDAEWLDEPMKVFLGKLTAGQTPAQIEQAAATAEQALAQAKITAEAAAANPNPTNADNTKKPGGPPNGKGAVAKADGLTEFAQMLVELRKAVQEQHEPTRYF